MLQPITKENFSLLLGRFTTGELETIIAKFPYTREAHVLLAKKYQLENNPAFDQQLQLAALYTQDRELLYALFNDKPAEQLFTQTQPTVIEPIPPIIEEPQKEIEQPIVAKEETTITTLEPVAEELPVVVTEPIEEELQVIVTSPLEEESPALVTEPVKEEETSILTAPVIESEPEVIAKELITESRPEEVPIQLEQKAIEAEVAAPAFAINEQHTFDEWLSNFTQNSLAQPVIEPLMVVEVSLPTAAPKPEEEEPIEQEQDELDKTIRGSGAADYLHNAMGEETRYSRGLDKFIEEQVKKKRRVDYKKPVEQNDIPVEMITETMAGIYEKQKKYAKAIRAYELLCLKFPEKIDLFAARINYLKKLT